MITTHTERLNTMALPLLPEGLVRDAWAWLHVNANVVIFTVRILFWSRTYRLRVLFPIFEKILGKDPLEADLLRMSRNARLSRGF